jgi:DNA topoisomerase-1
MKRFEREGRHTDFNSFDFLPVKLHIEKLREEKKNMSEEKKAEIKAGKDELNRFYGYALVDSAREKISGFAIEPPTLFKGRGKHPRAGLLKARIQPEMVTINLAESAPIPVCPLPGHSWGDIVHKHDVTWLCSYKDDTINPNSTHKYIFLAANSKFKGINDRKKYEKARKLKSHIEEIRRDYSQKLESSDLKNKQLGTATYLIDKLALRVGNEKGEDEADTVGCCSLRIEHISLQAGNKVTLDFLGKDSMQYLNTVEVLPIVWKNIEIFMKGKNREQDLFDKIDAQILNDYLRGLMDGLTAKVFRTYNASATLQRELNKHHLDGMKMEEKVERYE